MTLIRSFFFILSFSSFAVLSQGGGKPQKIAMKFAHAISEGNYEKAAEYCILEAEEDINKNWRTTKSSEVEIITVSCENYATNNGIDCECVSFINSFAIILIYRMTEVDGIWKIYQVDSKRLDPSQPVHQNPNKNKKVGNQASPEISLTTFAQFNEEKNYKKAGEITIMAAKNVYNKTIETDAGKLPVQIFNVECQVTPSGTRVECSCDQITASGVEERAYYELGLIEGKWKIIELWTSLSAESTVLRFVNAIAEGNCFYAQQLSTGTATETIQGSIDAGCVKYHTEIIKIECISNLELESECTCVEKRDGMEMTFNYDLKKINGKWLVSNYEKDLGLEQNKDGELIFEAAPDSIIKDTDSIIIEKEPSETVLDFCEIDPEFPGGKEEMMKFFQNEIKYPESAKLAGLTGTVYVQFVVSAEGTITNIVILKGISPDLDAEAIRVVRSMPTWIPGQQGGKNVSVRYQLPVKFQLTN
jgi:TonB family protein